MTPTPKVIAGGIAGSVTAIIVWATRQWGHADIPPEIAVAISTVVSFLASYFMPQEGESL